MSKFALVAIFGATLAITACSRPAPEPEPMPEPMVMEPEPAPTSKF